MFNNELMADVHFIVGPLGGSQRVPAHKVKTFLHIYEKIETLKEKKKDRSEAGCVKTKSDVCLNVNISSNEQRSYRRCH